MPRRNRNLKSLSVPSELRPMNQADAGGSIRVESTILEPVSRTSNSTNATGIVRFKIPHSGIMQRDIRFLFKVSGLTLADGMFAFNMNCGALGVIERAILSTSSGQILHDIDASNFLSMIKQNLVPCDVQNNLDRAELGNVNPWKFSSTGQLEIPLTEYSNNLEGNRGVGLTGFKTRLVEDQLFSVPLHKVFPVLQEDSSFFPLYKMKDDLIVEIHKANKTDYLISSFTNTAPAFANVNQVPVGLPAAFQLYDEKLAINFIHYPPQALVQIEKNMLNRVYPFIDYTLVRKNIPAIGVNLNKAGEQIIRVGLQDRTLRSIHLVKNHSTNKDAWFGNLYSTFSPQQTWNVKVNDRLLFNSANDNPAREYDLLEEVDSEVKPQIPLPLFSNNHQLNNAALCSTSLGLGTAADNIKGRMNVLGVDLRLVPNNDLIDANGIKIGTANVEFTLDYRRVDAEDTWSQDITACKLYYCYARAYSLGADGSLITSY